MFSKRSVPAWVISSLLIVCHGISQAGESVALGRPCPQPACGSSPCPTPTPAATEPTPPPAQPVEPTLAPEQFAATGGGEGFAASVPNVIGDHSSGACGQFTAFGGGLNVGLGYPGGCSGQNIAENNSPLPRDRVYFQYNLFVNETPAEAFGISNSLNINRYTFGAEKTFLDGLMSLQIAVPFASQITSDPTILQIQGTNNLPFNDKDVEFGNLNLTSKFLLAQRSAFALSSGLGVSLPTANDYNVTVRINDNNFVVPGLGTSAVDTTFGGTVTNDTVHLTPFLAGMVLPTSRTFVQGFLQVDVPVNSSSVNFSGSGTSNGAPLTLPSVSGDYKQQSLMRMNVGLGYWLYRNASANWITGSAPTLEVHYATSLENAEVLSSGAVPAFPGGPTAQFDFTNPSNRFDVVNLTLGHTLLLGERTSLATGFVIPLSSGDNKPFDFEFNLQLNWRFGYRGLQNQTPNVIGG